MRDFDDCPQCAERPGLLKVKGEYTAQQRVGAVLVEVVYLCPNGHLWAERFERGDKQIPTLDKLRNRKANGSEPPRAAPPPVICVIADCGRHVVWPDRDLCFRHFND